MKLTENFTLSEFNSKCGRPMPENVKHNIQKLANQLQVLRDDLKRPITITSGYRSPEHNARVGGVKNSQHVLGTACDIRVAGMTTRQLADRIELLISKGDMLQGAIGIYPNFVHYDIRKNRVRWSKV
jgi:uncharacterized protein YcbK (DUF882 family)